MRNKLYKYIKNVYELESSLYNQNLLLQKLNALKYELENYDGESFFDEYSTEGLLFERFYDIYDDVGDFFRSAIVLIIIGLILGAMIGAVFGNYFRGAIIGSVIGFFVFVLINAYCLFYGIFHIRKLNDENRKIRDENRNIYLKNKIDIDVSRQRACVVADEIEKIESIYDDTEEVLYRYYEMDIIFPKYRNLLAVSSFYDYLSSGRCDSLEGHEGAYNIFEIERRFEKICDKLDEAIYHLESLENNQYMLYSALQRCTQKAEQITDYLENLDCSIKNIENSHEIIEYNSSITAQNTEALKWLENFNN